MASIAFKSALVSIIFSIATDAQFLSYPYFVSLLRGSGANSSTCLAQYKSANASGTYSWGQSFINREYLGGNAAQELSWTISISENSTSGEFELDLWLGTPPGILPASQIF